MVLICYLVFCELCDIWVCEGRYFYFLGDLKVCFGYNCFFTVGLLDKSIFKEMILVVIRKIFVVVD